MRRNGVLTFPAGILSRRAEEVSDLVEAGDIAERMACVLLEASGIGLAAPQIGLPLRIAVIRGNIGPTSEPLVLINPVVTWRSASVSVLMEGCLSLPRLPVFVARPSYVEVDYTALNGERRSIRADGLLSKCLQHEIDHLDGRLVIDLVPADERARLLDLYRELWED